MSASSARSAAATVAAAVRPRTRPEAVRTAKTVQVVLLQQLDNLGHKGAKLGVAAGYARNYLIPSKRAVYATPQHVATHVVSLDEAALAANAEERALNTLRGRVAGYTKLRFTRATNDGKTLYAPISATEVLEALMGSELRRCLGQLGEENIRFVGGGVVEEVAGEEEA